MNAKTSIEKIKKGLESGGKEGKRKVDPSI